MSKLAKISARGKKDYYFFAREIVGFDKMSTNPHQELCDHIEKPGKRKKLTLMPRNSFKSSVVTVAGSMYALLHDPNERILIASETQKNAIKYVKEIRAHYEGNAKFRALYGDWVNKGHDTWRDGEIIVSKRTVVKKEASVTAGSLEKGIMTGMHYSVIVCDDVVSRNNTQNEDQIEKTLDFYKLLLAILDPTGRIFINGTRWHYLDLYGWILDPDNPEHKNFDVLVKQAVDGAGNVLMPTVLPKSFLDEQRAALGESTFLHQYQNQATVAEDQTFRPEWVRWYDQAPENLFYFITIDPAVSQSSEADYTGIVVVGCDAAHNWYVVEALQARLQPSEIYDRLFFFAEKYQPMMCLGMEKFALEKMLKVSLFEEMQKRKVFIPIKDVETDNRVAKEYRIRGLQPKFQAGQIFLRKDQKDLYHQIVMHPQLKHDDLVDALKTHLAITFPGEGGPAVEPSHNDSHLTPREKEIWDKVEQMGNKRRVRETAQEV